jgi:hypothetical protein
MIRPTTLVFWVSPYLSQLRHSVRGYELWLVYVVDEAHDLVLALPSLLLSQYQRLQDLNLLQQGWNMKHLSSKYQGKNRAVSQSQVLFGKEGKLEKYIMKNTSYLKKREKVWALDIVAKKRPMIGLKNFKF